MQIRAFGHRSAGATSSGGISSVSAGREVARSGAGAPSRERLVAAVLLVLCGLGVFFQLYGIGAQNFWVDELWIAVASDPRLPLNEFFRDWVLTDVHPPLYMLVIRAWRRVFGSSEAAIRALSAVATVGLTPLVLLMNRWEPMVRRPLALAAMLACSVAVVRYAQEARSYALLMFLSTLAMLLAVAIAGRMQRGAAVRRPLPALAATIVVAGYVHYFGVLVGFGVFGALALLALLRERRYLAPVLVSGLAAVAPMLPWIAFHATHLTDKLGGHFWIASNWRHIFLEVATLAGGRPQVFMVVAALAAVVAAIRPAILARPAVFVPLIAGALLVAAGAAISQNTPIVTGRNLMVLIPPFYLVLTATCGELEAARSAALRGLGLAIPVIFSAICLFYSAQRMLSEEREHWRETARLVASLPGCRESTLNVFFWPEEIYAYYLPHRERYKLRTFRIDRRTGLPMVDPPRGRCPLIVWGGWSGLVPQLEKRLGYEPGRIVMWTTVGHTLLLDSERLAEEKIRIPGLVVPDRPPGAQPDGPDAGAGG